MSHRISDPFHVREARRPAHLTDESTDQSTRAYAAIVAGRYKGVRSRESGGNMQPRGLAVQDSADPRNEREPSPAMVHARIRRTALVPAIITVPCPAHDAAPGEPCYRLGDTGRGVCGPRIETCAERVKTRAALR